MREDFPWNDLPAVRRRFAQLHAQAEQLGLALRPVPPEPSSCCGRGCNGCVWEGFYAAAAWWCEEAAQRIHEAVLQQPAAMRGGSSS